MSLAILAAAYAIVNPAPAREGSPVAVLERFALDYDTVYEFRRLIAFARENHADEQRARYAFAHDLRIALRAAVMGRPSEPMVDAALAFMLQAANYTMLADRLASEWTPYRIVEMDTLAAEADAAVDEIRAAEAAEDLELERFAPTSWADELPQPEDFTDAGPDTVEWAYRLTACGHACPF